MHAGVSVHFNPCFSRNPWTDQLKELVKEREEVFMTARQPSQ
jgi:hypothetical protein